MSGKRRAKAGAVTPVSLPLQFAEAAAGQKREAGTRPFSIRLSEADRQRLEGAAGSVPLDSFIRTRLLDEKPRRTMRRPVSDAVELGRVLGAIGRSNIASASPDLTSAAKLDTVTIMPELQAKRLPYADPALQSTVDAAQIRIARDDLLEDRDGPQAGHGLEQGRFKCEIWNELFEVLADWNTYLKYRQTDTYEANVHNRPQP